MSTEILATAINAAYKYLLAALTASGTPTDKVSNFRVEEAEIGQDGNYKITLSYDVVGDFAFEKQREYKDFEVSPTAEVISMKIRKVS